MNTLSTDHDTVLARYTATWTQIAAEFRDRSPKLALESINEPTFSGTSGNDENYALLAYDQLCPPAQPHHHAASRAVR